jgi:hypothetical protein
MRHVRSVASSNPDSTFDAHEISIRPACGVYIDRMRTHLLAMGYDVAGAQAQIKVHYDALRPKLVSVFQTAVDTTERQPSRQFGDEQVYLERARVALVKELDESHQNCIDKSIRNIVPYSDERAEILVEAVTADCMDFEKKRVQLLQVLFDAPRDQASRAVDTVLETEKRRVLANIVKVRAMLKKQEIERSGAAPEATGSVGRRTTYRRLLGENGLIEAH